MTGAATILPEGTNLRADGVHIAAGRNLGQFGGFGLHCREDLIELRLIVPDGGKGPCLDAGVLPRAVREDVRSACPSRLQEPRREPSAPASGLGWVIRPDAVTGLAAV